MAGETNSGQPQIPNGVAIAAYLAAMVGLLVFGIVVLACEASKPFAETIHGMGKAWIPGADRIGPYSGKQTALLLAWLGSWAALHFPLRKRQLNGKFWLIVFFFGLGAASLLIWPPFWHWALG